MSKRFLVAACAVAALAGAAIAQTSQTSPTTTVPPPQTPQTGQTQSGSPGGAAQTQSGQAGSSGQTAQPGLRTVDPTTVRLTFYTVQPTDMPLSNLYDLDVYNLQNEDIGEIEDVIVDNGKTIKAIILSIGGFLGIGERYVAVDPSSVVITRQGDNYRAVVNTSREDLRNAPTFKFEGNMRRIDE